MFAYDAFANAPKQRVSNFAEELLEISRLSHLQVVFGDEPLGDGPEGHGCFGYAQYLGHGSRALPMAEHGRLRTTQHRLDLVQQP